MFSRPRRSSHHYELLAHQPFESPDHLPLDRPVSAPWYTRLSQTFTFILIPGLKHLRKSSGYASLLTPRRRRRSLLRVLLWAVFLFSHFILLLFILTATFLPSYTTRPSHYDSLRRAALETSLPGRANPRNESVFIATSIYERDGALTSGAWGDAIVTLVDLLGPKNVYLSVYENDPDPVSRQSLDKLGQRVQCNSSINDESLPLDSLPRVTLPSGEKRVKRIAFLAEVRNRALLPLENADTTFDRLLFINDVVFDPVEAAQLLFATNIDSSGRANYGAACAVDFINPFKFYDRFATRDLDGYSMGIPFFPWFTDAGSQASRQDVLAEKDAVRVRSCWGGMTAFEAKWFQGKGYDDSNAPFDTTASKATPLRFRFEEEIFWDSSECCLIHADLQYRRSGVGMPEDSGIYLNPFIRVAYDEPTLKWLAFTRRPERLYSIIHNILNHMVGFPLFNPRRTEEPGQMVPDKEWDSLHHTSTIPGNVSMVARGSYHDVDRIAKPGGFCGGRKLLLINEDPQKDSKWDNVPIPGPPR